MNLRISYDHARAIPVVPVTDAAQAGVWAHDAAERFLTLTGSPLAVDRLVTALRLAALEASGDRQTFVLIDRAQQVLAPLTLVAVAAETARDEQLEFLCPPPFVLLSAAQRATSATLGDGISAASVERREDAVLGFSRWLFPGQGGAVAAVLGPVSPYALGHVTPIADELLNETTWDGFVPATDSAAVDDLLAACARFGDPWDPADLSTVAEAAPAATEPAPH